MSGEEEPYSAIVIERRQQVVSTFSSKKQAEIAITTQTPKVSAPVSIFEKYDMIKKKN
jgi:hypothetical protein